MGKRRTRKEKIQAKIRQIKKPIVLEEKVEGNENTKIVLEGLVRTGLITLGLLGILLGLYWRLR